MMRYSVNNALKRCVRERPWPDEVLTLLLPQSLQSSVRTACVRAVIWNLVILNTRQGWYSHLSDSPVTTLGRQLDSSPETNEKTSLLTRFPDRCRHMAGRGGALHTDRWNMTPWRYQSRLVLGSFLVRISARISWLKVLVVFLSLSRQMPV
jgi:hypothetical protein